MNKPLVDRIPFAKILIVLVIVFGVSLGLCGVSAALGIAGSTGSSHMRNASAQILGFSLVIELVAMVLSSVGVVVTGIAWVILSIAGKSSRGSAEPQPLFNENDNKREDEDGKL